MAAVDCPPAVAANSGDGPSSGVPTAGSPPSVRRYTRTPTVTAIAITIRKPMAAPLWSAPFEGTPAQGVREATAACVRDGRP